jgi:hypothetical protein
MDKLQLFARLLKVDEAKRQITGVIANESVDASGEVFDYDTSKPFFQKWSDKVSKASDGKSVGNVRAQHGSIVAGRLTDITFDDVAKSITVTSDIVDDNEWTKVQKGCYTGFSIGGKYEKKWDDVVKSAKRYTANPTEVSIVDLPCNDDATFEFVGKAGSPEMRKFLKPEDTTAKPAAPMEMTKAQFDMLKAERDKLDKVAQKDLYDYMTDVIAAAEAEIAPPAPVAKTAPEACPKRDAYAKALAKAAVTRPDVQAMLKFAVSQIKESDEALKKSLYDVGRLSDALCSLGWISDAAMYEAEIEGDGSTVPEQIRKTLGDLGKALVDMVKEEVAEFLSDHGVKKDAPVTDLAKSADLAKTLGDAVTKAMEPVTAHLNKALETVNENFTKLNTRLEAIEKQPTQNAPRLRVVEKSTEVTTLGETKEVKPVMDSSTGKTDDVTTLIKSIHADGPKPLMKGLAI